MSHFDVGNINSYREPISRIAGWLAPLASLAFILSFVFPEWRDHSAFELAVLELTPNRSSDDAFLALRDGATTMIFALRDHAAALAIAAWSWIVSCRYWAPICRLLAKRSVLALLPMVIGLSLAVGGFAALMIDYNRHVYPAWADTMAIPAVGLILASIMLTLFMCVHWLFLLAGSSHGATWLGIFFRAYVRAALAAVGIAMIFAGVTGGWFILPTLFLTTFFLVGLDRRLFPQARVGRRACGSD